MTKDLGKILKNEEIQTLELREPLCVEVGTPAEKVIGLMKEKRRGSVLVLGNGKLAGIFTERDVLNRLMEKKVPLSTPIEKVMTPKPKSLKPTDSIAEAIRLMSQGGYRHVPLVDPHGAVRGLLSVRQLVHYLAEHFPAEIFNLPPDPHQIQRSPEGA